MKNKLRFAASAFLATTCALTAFTGPARAADEQLLLVAGMQHTITVNFEPCSAVLECIRLANNALAQVQYSKDLHQIILTPVKRGETTLTVRGEKGDIRAVYNLIVTDQNVVRWKDEMASLLRDAHGVTARLVGPQIAVEGDAVELDDLKKVRAVVTAEPYKYAVLNLVGLSQPAYDKVAALLQDALKSPGATVKAVNGSFIIDAKAGSRDEAKLLGDRAHALLDSVLPEIFAPKGKPDNEDFKRIIRERPYVVQLTLSGR